MCWAFQSVKKGLTEFGSKSQIEFYSFLARACTGPKILIVRQVCGFLEQKSVRAVGLQTRANACICAKGCQKHFFDSLKAQLVLGLFRLSQPQFSETCCWNRSSIRTTFFRNKMTSSIAARTGRIIIRHMRPYPRRSTSQPATIGPTRFPRSCPI